MQKRIREEIDAKYRDYYVAVSKAHDAKVNLQQAQDTLDDTSEAQRILQIVAQSVQEVVHRQISGVVSQCLRFVFEDPYAFRIEFERKRGRTEAKLVFAREGIELSDPLREVGGGVVDVAAFALRLACLVKANPPVRRMLVLDEPFSKLRGYENRQRIRDMVRSLADELDVQFIMNVDTDVYPEFEMGEVVRVG